MVTDRLQILLFTFRVDWPVRVRRATRRYLDVVLRSSITADAVHPRAGKFQTNLATVPEYMKSSLLRVVGTWYAHRFLHPNQVMNAVVIMDANKAVNHARPTDNSGLPLSW